MRILIFSEWFSERMGYSENCLPKTLAALGHEVHLVTSNTQIYFDSPIYKEVYEKFLGPGIVECGTKQMDGFTLYRLPYYLYRNRMGVNGLFGLIRKIKPEIVQTFDTHTFATLQFALYRSFFRYGLFLETHVHASVMYPIHFSPTIKFHISQILRKAVGIIISSQSTRCYPISIDSSEVATNYYGINPRLMKIVSLGVDTDMFRPVDEKNVRQRDHIRDKLGFNNHDVVAIYSGRLSEDKNPYCLAQAIQVLQSEQPTYRALFIGNGPQVKQIQQINGCIVLPFMPAFDLADYYRSADIGIWPKQESTSQIDAAVCGLPIIISDRTHVPERIQGNGLTYHENDPNDLALKIKSLADSEKRRKMGSAGSKRLSEQYSWNQIAKDRILDYQKSLSLKA